MKTSKRTKKLHFLLISKTHIYSSKGISNFQQIKILNYEFQDSQLSFVDFILDYALQPELHEVENPPI